MEEAKCLIGIVIFVVIPIAFALWHGQRQQKRALAERQRLMAARLEHGEHATQLLEQLCSHPDSPALQRDLYRLLNAGRFGHAPELTAPGGWFERAVPVLRRLAKSESGSTLLGAYFTFFEFPAGQQAQVLQFLLEVLNDAKDDATRLELFKNLADRVLATGGGLEAQWLYARTLDAVRRYEGSPATKAIALHFGRRSYSFDRLGKIPTVYDEQAIANDIAAQVRGSG